MPTTKPEPCTIVSESLVDKPYGYYGITIDWADWNIVCSCGAAFSHRLLSGVNAEWRDHAGIVRVREVNDANVLSA